MNGNSIILVCDQQTVAGATGVTIEMSQEAEEYTQLPGTHDNEEDEQWAYYRPGARSWTISHEGFYALANTFPQDVSQYEDKTYTAYLQFSGQTVKAQGTAHLSDISVGADVNGIVTFSASFVGDNFPEIK